MPDIKEQDPTGERAGATEAMEKTPISGKDHEFRADGDHRPRPAAPGQETAPTAGAESERHISEGIPGAGRSPDDTAPPDVPPQA